MSKLIGISVLVELLAILGIKIIEWEYEGVFLLTGIAYYLIMYNKYRNKSARHKHEAETKKTMRNIFKVDGRISKFFMPFRL